MCVCVRTRVFVCWFVTLFLFLFLLLLSVIYVLQHMQPVVTVMTHRSQGVWASAGKSVFVVVVVVVFFFLFFFFAIRHIHGVQ